MRLSNFRIQNFKSIIDSDYCTFASDLTVLVGKNESGKTATLEALKYFSKDAKRVSEDALPLNGINSEPMVEICFRLAQEEIDTIKLQGFEKMLSFTGQLHQAGARLVLGSHSWTPYDKFGNAYYNEMDLWAKAGIDNVSILRASTIENARYFKIEDRLGSIEEGKQADLILVRGNPLDSIQSIRNIERVMLNGVWIDS